MPSRVKLLIDKKETGKSSVKRKSGKRKRVPLLFKEEDSPEGITVAIAKGVHNFFKGYERIGCTDWIREGKYVEIYDLNHDYFVGAIYPDGACMIWPSSWYHDQLNGGKIYECKNEITFSEMARNNEAKRINKRRETDKIRNNRKKQSSKKRKRVQLK